MRTLLFPFALIAGLGISVSATACPENCFFTPGGIWTCTSAASADTAFDATAYPPCFKSAYFRGYTAGYDLPHGTLYASAIGGFDGACGPGVAATDDFVVGGLPDGTPVPLRVQLAMEFWINCILPGGSEGTARLASGAQSTELVIALDHFAGLGVQDTSVVLALTVTAGTPFRLTASTQVRTGECAGAIHGSLMFLDLPPTASVVSCNGFVQAPTPVRTTTWGAVKAGYR